MRVQSKTVTDSTQTTKTSDHGISDAVRAILQVACRGPHERTSRERPLACFLLSGLCDSKCIGSIAVAVADAVYVNADAVIRIGMSKYTEKHHLWQLLAHTGGLICAWVPGELTDPVLEQPKSVILLEDIDKVHREFYRVLASIINEGKIVDGIGREVGFQESVIIMTAKPAEPSGYDFPIEVANQIDGVLDLH